tara:strand:+ start:3260 stop:3457 length:198 start_codon:yes stop_codon:yes gene_type:complete
MITMEKNMTNVTKLNDVKNPEPIELMDKIENAIIDTANLTPIELIGVLEMIKAKYTNLPLLSELE